MGILNELLLLLFKRAFQNISNGLALKVFLTLKTHSKAEEIVRFKVVAVSSFELR